MDRVPCTPPMTALALTLLLAGCTPPPDPQAVAAQLLAGDRDGARAALADLDADSPLIPWRDLLDRAAALDAEQASLRQAERAVLLDTARTGLETGDLDAVAPALRALGQLDPEDPELIAILDTLAAEAGGAPAPRAAALWALLAALRPTPEAEAQRDRARLLARYAPETFDLRGLTGATPEAGCHLLDRLDREYHRAPDWPAVVAAAQAHLGWLQEDPSAQARWPGLASAPFADMRAEVPCAALQAAAAAAEAAEVPAPLAVDAWLAGALGHLDPWTRVVWPAEIASWTAHHEGVRVGPGLSLSQDEAGDVYVSALDLSGPAWASGAHVGDRVDAMEDHRGRFVLAETPAETRLAAAVGSLPEAPDTPLTLSLNRPGVGPLTVTVTRGPVTEETVWGLARGPDNAWDVWLDPDAGLAYVRVLGFRPPTEADFDALLEFSGARGVVLDLRGNGGGDINAAVQIADRFVAEGVLAETSGRVQPDTGPETDPATGEALAPWNHAVPGHALEGAAVVVLVDADTASAAEVLAGALQERAGAALVGAPTWGKGMAQALRISEDPLYAVQFTNLVWTLPSGRQLAHGLGGGITPSLEARLSPAAGYQVHLDARRRAALQAHADGTPMPPPDFVAREDLPTLSGDPALVLAELALRARLALSPTD
ncbi:MAG: hypothetical protein H6739_11035 [Alphaproteobacteria bacterium]|nr:hypothetical protein [Alphaproteobacteria bacterium]